MGYVSFLEGNSFLQKKNVDPNFSFRSCGILTSIARPVSIPRWRKFVEECCVFFCPGFLFQKFRENNFFGVSLIHNLKYILNVNFPFSGRKRVEGIGSWWEPVHIWIMRCFFCFHRGKMKTKTTNLQAACRSSSWPYRPLFPKVSWLSKCPESIRFEYPQ